jgi:integrase
MAISKFHKAGCNGEGCECPWRLTYRPQGVRGPLKRLNFATKKQAEKHQADTMVKASRGEYVDPRKVPTFAEVAERWYESKTDRRPGHVSNLRQRLDKHILPVLGAERLDRITVAMVEKFRNDLRAAGYARRTIVTIVWMINSVFEAAIRRGECSTNPVSRMERSFAAAVELDANDHGGDRQADPAHILSPDQIPALLGAAQPGWQRTLFTVAYLTGMRCGELLALAWDAVDFEGGKIHVRRSLTRAGGQSKFYPPKTKAGIRSVSIAPELVSALKVWKLACPTGPLNLVFPNPDAPEQPADKDRARRALHAALRRARLSRVNFHSLRHSCASAMILAGAPITEIQHRLGHATPAVTLSIYSHFFRDAETDAAARLATALFKPRRVA